MSKKRKSRKRRSLSRDARGRIIIRAENGKTTDIKNLWDTYPNLTVWIIIGFFTLASVGTGSWFTSVYAQIVKNTNAVIDINMNQKDHDKDIALLKKEDEAHIHMIGEISSRLYSIETDIKTLLKRSR